MRRPSFLVPVSMALAALLPKAAGAHSDASGNLLGSADAGARGQAKRLTQPLLALAHAAGFPSSVLGHSSHSSHVSHASHVSHTSHASSSGTPSPPTTPSSPSTGSSNPASKIRFAANLTVPAEVPHPNGAPLGASGKWTATMSGSILSWRLTLSHLSSATTVSFIHTGGARKVGPHLVRVCGPCTSPASGKIHLSSVQRAALIAGLTYINLGTTRNPKGEIRGQIRRVS